MTISLLLTGFEPFGGEPVNPSQQLVERLGAEAPPHPALRVATAVLPVDIARVRPALEQALRGARPDVVLAFGQAAGRGTLCLETRAFNELDFRGVPDNGGHVAHGEALVDGAPECLLSDLPLERLAARLGAAGHAVTLSHDAGRHLCNALLFELLHRHAPLRAAFVHLPALPEQAARRERGEPGVPLETSLATVRALLAALPDELGG